MIKGAAFGGLSAGFGSGLWPPTGEDAGRSIEVIFVPHLLHGGESPNGTKRESEYLIG